MEIYVSALSIQRTSREKGLQTDDLPLLVRQMGFEGVELSDRAVSNEDGPMLRRLRENCSRADCGLIIDVNSDLTYTHPKLWQRETAHVARMVRVSHDLGAKCVRICLGGQSLSIQRLLTRFGGEKTKNREVAKSRGIRQGVVERLFSNRWGLRITHLLRKHMMSRVRNLEAKMRRALDSLREIMPAAEKFRVPLAIENHWGISSRPENIIQLVKAIDSPWLGTCPDFGNFPREVDPYEGLGLLAPMAFHVHAKSVRFGGDGSEKDTDYDRCLRILRENRYDGTFTVEYEGWMNDLEGCLRTRELILRYW